ncbi:MAG: hypothetical protein DMG58_19400 [Acidobacteria bacterium]|nr:MAG: hypothetical protein DMG58_19400 [Acidobacteriota bacterium]
MVTEFRSLKLMCVSAGSAAGLPRVSMTSPAPAAPPAAAPMPAPLPPPAMAPIAAPMAATAPILAASCPVDDSPRFSNVSVSIGIRWPSEVTNCVSSIARLDSPFTRPARCDCTILPSRWAPRSAITQPSTDSG